MSMARRTLPSRLELKSFAGSFSEAPLANVSFTTLLYVSPVQMMPSCDHTGVPIHFHSSTTSGSACLMSSRILLSVSPRQSPRSAILFEMSCEALFGSIATIAPCTANAVVFSAAGQETSHHQRRKTSPKQKIALQQQCREQRCCPCREEPVCEAHEKFAS